MAGGTLNHARRPAALFGVGDYDCADDAHGLRSGVATDRRAHRLGHRSARACFRRARLLDFEPLEQDAGRTAAPTARARPAASSVDSTGLKLGGARKWLVEKHGTSRRRSWRKLHIGIDAVRIPTKAATYSKLIAATIPD